MAGGEIGSKSNTIKDSDDDDDDIGSSSRRKRKKQKAKQEDAMDVDGSLPKRLEKIRLESDVMPPMTHYCVGIMRDRE